MAKPKHPPRPAMTLGNMRAAGAFCVPVAWSAERASGHLSAWSRNRRLLSCKAIEKTVTAGAAEIGLAAAAI